MIHEIFGLSDWAKEMADELAEEGFIVIAPDLLSGFGPGGGGSSEFTGQDAVMKLSLIHIYRPREFLWFGAMRCWVLRIDLRRTFFFL